MKRKQSQFLPLLGRVEYSRHCLPWSSLLMKVPDTQSQLQYQHKELEVRLKVKDILGVTGLTRNGERT
jgi:hypothetical protein